MIYQQKFQAALWDPKASFEVSVTNTGAKRTDELADNDHLPASSLRKHNW